MFGAVDEGSAKVSSVVYYLSVLAVFGATVVSIYTIFLHLKNYRRPDLQRLTIRILIMIPIYGIASLISLSSRYLSFFIDTIRDIYEAFVIYSFFILLINYLNGERALLDLIQNRLRIHHLFPFNYCFRPILVGDPDNFLLIKQGVLQFVILKPIIGVFIMGLKIFDLYDEGYIAWDSSYLWLSLIYNASVCTAMYCLVLFYYQCSHDLKPYRPMPKFICVKSLIFLTFWQGLLVSFLVWAGVIREKGTEYSTHNISQAYQDALLCLEMPFFAWLHWYAFPWTDYDTSRLSSRLQVYYAFRDCMGMHDIVVDTRETFSNVLPKFNSSNNYGVYLDDDEVLPFNRPQSSRYLNSTIPLEFELDSTEEIDYENARGLTFGDGHYPVIHEHHQHPPEVQDRIRKNATEFYERVRASQELQPSASSSLRTSASDLWNLDDTSDQVPLTITPHQSPSKTGKGKGRV
ncbi:organic solute transporter Ostalpha-domain-containing protein [Globomyces pollinis-pini]|nr:organic solute transporter Ostalpha-domain-containing protein [Globomyces pollinis-pini]